MNSEVLLVSLENTIENKVIQLLNGKKSPNQVGFREISDQNNIQLVILGCDFKCSICRCINSFIFLLRTKRIPIFVLRPFLLNPNIDNRAMFHMSRLNNIRLSPHQGWIKGKIENGFGYDENSRFFYHSSDSVYKILFIQKYLAGNPYNKKSLFTLATSINFSTSWLSHNFKTKSGFSLTRYSNKIRLCHALWELLSTDKLVKTIALDLGYQPLYFTKRFHSWAGLSPTEIRRSIGSYKKKERLLKKEEYQCKKLHILSIYMKPRS